MAKTKAIRVSDREDKLIKEFLSKNPFFDFSSLARTSIMHFIENPQLQITPVKQKNLNKTGAINGRQ